MRLRVAGAGALGADRAKCRLDPLHWIKWYGWVVNPKDPDPEARKLPLILWPKQVELVERALRSRANQAPLLVNKAREIGASWLMLHLVAHGWMFEPGFSAHLGSRKEDLVDNRTIDSLFGKLRWIIKHQPAHLVEADDYDDSTARLIHKRNGSEITGESTNAGWGRQGRKSVLFLDEFAHVEPALQELIWIGIESVASSRWVVSTPNGKGNKFHLLRTLYRNTDKLIELDWTTNPARTPEWFEGRLFENGGDLTWDERAQEHACDFSGVTGERIWKFSAEKVAYTDTDLSKAGNDRARSTWMLACAMDFGSGPSLTVFGGGLVDWGDPPVGPPHIWVDVLRFWQRRPAYEVAQDARAALEEYNGPRVITGDPAGRNKESDQESWESNLRGSGLGVTCLDSSYNEPFKIQKTIEEVQQLFDRGCLHIHGERCKALLEACEQWGWDLPRSIPLTLLNKAEIKPKKDQWSHFGDMLRYLVGAVLRELRPKTVTTKPHPEVAPRAKVRTIFGELRGEFEDAIDGGTIGGRWPTV